MYRNKMLIIATVFVVVLLGIMIWSSHVVADNHAEQRQEQAEESTDISEGDFAKEHANDELMTPQQKPEVDPNIEANTKNGLYIDPTGLEPEMSQRYVNTRKIEENYLDSIAASPERLILWNKSTLPLKVHIRNEQNLDAGFADAVKTAFTNWQNVSNNFVTFEFLRTPTNANIIVEIFDKPTGNCTADPEADAEKKYSITNNLLQKVELKVSKEGCDGKQRTAANIFTSVQHQVGHLLGINAHSPNVYDVMYEKSSFENLNVTDVDIATLKLLYNFAPDVTNKNYTPQEIAKYKFLKYPHIKGKTKEEIAEYLDKNITKSNDKADPVSKLIDSGLASYNNKDYKRAIADFEKALTLEPSILDRAYIHRALALSFLNMKHLNEAYKNAKAAYGISPTGENEYLMAYIKYLEGNDEEALKHLAIIFRDYPKIRFAYSLAGKIYEKNSQKNELRELSRRANENFPDDSPVNLIEYKDPNSLVPTTDGAGSVPEPIAKTEGEEASAEAEQH